MKKKPKTPWPDRDFWDFLRGVKVETYNYSQIHTTRDVVFPDHPRVPTKPIEFRAENFAIKNSDENYALRIANPKKGVQPSPANKWRLPVSECSHQSVFQVPLSETQGWIAHQCGDCGFMTKQSPSTGETFTKSPHDADWKLV